MTDTRSKRTSLIQLLMAVSFFFLLFGCNDEYVQPVITQFRYFPTEEGFYRIYQVDSIVHAENDNNNDDSVYYFRFQVKEVIDSSYIDAAGDTAQLVVRYHRPDSSVSWVLTAVWTQKLVANGAFTTEDNVIYHKLALPANTTVVWDANAGNTLGEEPCYYMSIDVPEFFGPFSYDSTATVFHRDEDNFVERKFGREVYATGIGLVHKDMDDLGKRNGIVVSGLEYRMTLVEVGNR